MKKIFAFICASLAVIFMSVPFGGTAEAARVAVLPIQIDEAQVERASDFYSYYWDVMIEKFKYPDYELMDEEDIDKFVPEDGLKNFDQATLTEICEKINAEIVVAMRLEKIDEHSLNFRREPTLETFMKGEFASFNRLTGKYFHKKLYHKGEIEEVLTLRTDWQQQVFASELKRYINRTIEVKKSKNKF